jgi:hypothetical protein
LIFFPEWKTGSLLAHRKRRVWYAAAINIAKIAPVALLMALNIENPFLRSA